MTIGRHSLQVMAFLGTAALVAGLFAGLAGLGIDKVTVKYLPSLPPRCPPQAIEPAPMSQLSLKIYNSSNVEGLATKEAKILKIYGTKIISTGNMAAPNYPGLSAEAIIIASSKSLPEAVALQSIYPKSVFVLDETDPVMRLFLTKGNLTVGKTPATTQTPLRCKTPESRTN